MQAERIYDFIKNEKYAVISSVNEAGQPESALVAFSETENLEIIIATGDTTRKVQNILLNPDVSIVIGFDGEELTSVQYEGTARVLPMEVADEYAAIHYEKHPILRKQKDKPGECFIAITPVWARFTDFGSHPEDIFEVYFNAD